MMSKTVLSSRRRRFHLENLELRSLLASVSGVVFDDADGSGSQDPGETPIAGWTVLLDTDQDSIADPGEATVVTGVDGTYTFSLPAATAPVQHYFEAILPPGDVSGRWLNTTNNYERVIIDPAVDPDPAITLNFGFGFVPYSTFAPQGGESLVNQTTAGQQGVNLKDWDEDASSIAADNAGNYAVTWMTPGASGVDEVWFRVFNADGSPRTGEIKVADSTRTVGGAPGTPLIAMAGDGSRIVVSWNEFKAGKSGGSPFTQPGSLVPFAQVYAGNGTAIGARIQAVPFRNAERYRGTGLAMDGNGDFTLLIQGTGGITQFQRYTSQGAVSGKIVLVIDTSLINGNQGIGMDSAGNFTVTWEEFDGIYAQRYSSGGTKVGGRITVISDPPDSNGANRTPSIAMSSGGQFAIVYNADVYTNSRTVVQKYSAAGSPIGGRVELGPWVNVTAVSMDAAANLTIANMSRAVHPNWITVAFENATEIQVRRLSAAGVLSETQVVNTTTEGSQVLPSVAATSNGFIVTWCGRGASDDQGVFVQRYTTDVPVQSASALAVYDAAVVEYLLSLADDEERS